MIEIQNMNKPRGVSGMPYIHIIRCSRNLLLACSILLSSLAYTQPGTINTHLENSNSTQDLSGYDWKVKMMKPGQGIREGIHQLPPEDIETLVWNPAKVPGDIYTDLWRAGVIEDPYYGQNSSKAAWVMYEEWWYAKQFNVAEDIGDKRVRLDFAGVDYSCEVWLNGHFLGHHEGAFSPFSFDVTNQLRSSKQYLRNKNLLMIKLDPPPQVNNKVVGLKTPWFGDYWRDLVPFGITGPIKLVTTGKVVINNVYTHSTLNNDGSANVHVEVSLENLSSNIKTVLLGATMQGHNFKSDPYSFEIEIDVKPGTRTIKEEIHIENPQLWFPWDLGEQNLYSSEVSLTADNILLHHTKHTFGIREVNTEWNPGFEKGVDVSFPRTVLINGRHHFIRSANWGGPPDIFVGRTSLEEYKKLIQLAKEANMNNIRIFGWHPPEIPEFYEMCNEAGLTVWQDVIPLGTGNIPRDRDFLDRIIQEAIEVVKVRRNNPCLILLEGGEEALLRATDGPFMNDFLIRLGDSIQKYLDLPYVPDSPLTNRVARELGYKAKEAEHALAYFYRMGEQPMEDYFSSLDFPIIPELAITSVPNVESLHKFIPEEELWPPGLSWGHHWADLDRLRIQNFDAFGDERTGSLHEFVNATQDAQGIIFQYGVEHVRRQKPRSSAISLCHFITYWPDMKWGFIDNYQEPKRSFNYVKKAYQPLLVSLKYDKRRWRNNDVFKSEIWIVNDFIQQFDQCEIRISLKNEDGQVLKQQLFPVDNIEAYSSAKFAEIDWDVLQTVKHHFYIELSLHDQSGEVLSNNDYMLLIGDKDLAAIKFKAMGQEIRKHNSEYSYGNYYRFFPDLINEDGKSYQSKTQIPRARGFEKNQKTKTKN